jgi:hypothetical protein
MDEKALKDLEEWEHWLRNHLCKFPEIIEQARRRQQTKAQEARDSQ